jgi:hypothetical protein
MMAAMLGRSAIVTRLITMNASIHDTDSVSHSIECNDIYYYNIWYVGRQ